MNRNAASDGAGETPPVEAFLDALRQGESPSVSGFAAGRPDTDGDLEALLPLIAELQEAYAGLTGPPGETPCDKDLPPMEGTHLQPIRRIAVGGMGTVYEAQDVLLNRRCALKLLRPSFSADADARRLFIREARMLAGLRHPNIVPVYSAGESDGRIFYAMELMEGADRPLRADSPEAVARIGLQAASALAHAHRFGILHCDVKPSNLMTGPDGTVRLGDFGLARLLNSADGDVGGTLRYMAPERLRGGPSSVATDQYSLGVTLRELLSGELPRADTPTAVLRGTETLPPLPPLPKSCPADLAAVIDRMCASDADRRYGSVSRAADDLRRFLEHRPVSARRTPPLHRLALAFRRRPLTVSACALAVLCSAGTATALCVGHWRTYRARLHAEANARLAAQTLNSVFGYIDRNDTSPEGTRLLQLLLPYYRSLTDSDCLTEREMEQASEIVGTAALRSGRYGDAERVMKTLYGRRPTARIGEKYAGALANLGKHRELGRLNADLIGRFADSASVPERLAALAALIREGPGYPNAEALFLKLVGGLRRDAPDHPSLKLMIADVCSLYPGLLKINGPNARIIGELRPPQEVYSQLSDSPSSPATFRLLDLMTEAMENPDTDPPPSDAQLQNALVRAESVFGDRRSPERVQLAALRFYSTYIRYLKRHGSPKEAAAYEERFIGLLRVCYHSRRMPREFQRTLLHLLGVRLNEAKKNGRTREAKRLTDLLGRLSPEYRDGMRERRKHGEK